jgi:hypothetical protein
LTKETPYVQKQHRTVINRTCDSSNNEQNTLPLIQVMRQVAFDADQTPHLRTNSHCLTHA